MCLPSPICDAKYCDELTQPFWQTKTDLCEAKGRSESMARMTTVNKQNYCPCAIFLQVLDPIQEKKILWNLSRFRLVLQYV